MIPKIAEKPTMVIAGPGAGKTHDMVKRIVDAIPDLKPNRILAAITFTNAATDSIKERLLKEIIHIPYNVFIGTNYSFFNKFILIPFSSLFTNVPMDKLFLEIDIRKLVDKLSTKNNNPAYRNAIRVKVQNNLIEQGKIPFDQIPHISAKLIKFKQVQQVVANKIQFLFKDEFQDTDTIQLKIFNAIRQSKKTTIYSVGDPEQYILGFTYNLRGVKKPSFKDIPITKFRIGCSEHVIESNRRSCEQIVEFTNNFHTILTQVSEVCSLQGAGVLFIADTDIDIIISKFIAYTQNIIDSCDNHKRLFLGFENKTFDGFIDKYKLLPISNEHGHTKSMLSESLGLISSATQLNSKQIRDKYKLDMVAYRKLGIKILELMINNIITSTTDLILILNNDFGIPCPNEAVNLDKKIDLLKKLMNSENYSCGNNYYTTIHKAKGLEADCVLVISKNQGELNKWLETDYEKRLNDKEDTCRIGYVGFTRAKQILCIACKKPIDKAVTEKLLSLKVKFIN